MVIIMEGLYPPQSAKEIGKRWMEAETPWPDYVTPKGAYLSGVTGLGIKAFLIYEFDRAKMAEALEHVNSRVGRYMDIPGYTYSIQVWNDAQETMKMIGLG